MPGAPKPKVKYEKPTIKKRIATAAAVGLLGGSIALGLHAIEPLRASSQRSDVKTAIAQIDKKKADVGSRPVEYYSKNPNLIRETVNSYNQKAKLGQIFFYDGKKIKSVYFDQTRLNQITSIIPKSEKAKIDSLISRKIEKVEATAKQNVVLGKKIIDRVGELDYTKYLLSLTPRELKNAFPEAEIAVRKALERSNPEIFKKINAEKKGGVLFSMIVNTIWGSLWGGAFLAKGKKIK
ncbi:MAG TPA: hypothetical protein PLK55_01645 [archaeon]|nr:hypothetical protein [archaeon]